MIGLGTTLGLGLGLGPSQRPFVGLLDRLSAVPIVALSTRRLRSGAWGAAPLATIRETGANGEAAFGDAAFGGAGVPPRLDFPAVDGFVGAATGRWKVWHDQAGGPDAVQATNAAQPLYVNGSGPDFDGAGQFLTIPHTPAQLLTEGLTIACWIRPDAFGSRQIIDKSDSGAIANGFRLQIGVTDTMEFRVTSGNVASSGVFTPGEQQHVVCICNASGAVSFYRNGLAAGTGTTNPTINITTTNPLRIGTNFGGAAAFYNGRIDELMVFPSVISENDRVMLYEIGAPI